MLKVNLSVFAKYSSALWLTRWLLLLPQVGDELLEINGYSTEGMFHADAVTMIKHGGDYVKLIVSRVSWHHHHHGELLVGRSQSNEINYPCHGWVVCVCMLVVIET